MICRILGLLIALALLPLPAGAEARLPVVASMSVLADMTARIGGDRVAVTALVPANADAHVYEPNPTDVKSIAAARLMVLNGLGLEGWLPRLLQAAGFRGEKVTASDGIALMTLREESVETLPGRSAGQVSRRVVSVDPHGWQDLANGRIYVHNIADGLARVDPANAAYYQERAVTYAEELAALDKWVRDEFVEVPAAKRKIITSHDAFSYFATAYGVTIQAPVGMSTDSEPTARDVAQLIRQIKRDGIKALFIENMVNPRLVRQIARDAGGIVGGELFSDALSKADGPASTYVQMFRHNVATMKAAMVRN